MPARFDIHNASILVVDDSDADARLLEAMLTGSGFSRVTITTDPLAACDLYREHRHDLVILDLLMPTLDGFELMARLHEVDRSAYVPLLAVTADPGHMERALEAGARDFIGKPLRLPEVLARVGNMLEVSLMVKELDGHGRELERKLDERSAALRESEELFRLFAANLPEGIFIRQVEERTYKFFNPAFERLLGKRLELGGAIAEGLAAIHPEDRPQVMDEIGRRPEGNMNREMRFLHADGGERWAHVRTFPITDGAGRNAGVGGILEDITERRATEQALLETVSHFRALVEQSVAGIYVVENGRFSYANPRMCELLGYPLSEICGMDSLQVIVEEDRERALATRRRVLAGDPDSLAATYRLRRKDGAILHLRVEVRVVMLERRQALLGIGMDVTESERAHALLREAESHYRALVEQSLVGIFIMVGSRVIYANPMLCALLGRPLAELMVMDVKDLVLESDHPVLASVIERRRGGESGSIAMMVRAAHADGRALELSVESKVVDLAAGKATMGVVRDVTERALAAQALRESEEKYRLLWETTSDAVLLLGDDGRIEYANRSVLDVFGYTPEEVEGRDIAVLQPPALRERHRAGIRRYLASGARKLDWRGFETLGLHRDGREFPIEVAFSHMAVGGRSIFAGFMRDITQRKAAQDALESANRRLSVLSRRVLDIQEEERRGIARELHDDVGQSLVALKMGLHMLAERGRDSDAVVLAQCIEVAQSVGDKLHELSVRLLPPQLEQLGLQDALRWLVKSQRAMTGLNIGCRFGLESRRYPPEIEGACFRICQEALNNASRHSRAPEIVIELDAEGEALILVVRDDGVGFDERRERRLGGRLGLLGMEERARLAGGSLAVHSAPGHGTRIVATLPFDAPAAISRASRVSERVR